jgi:succinyl-diaminopimelate desuccinylase
MTTSKEILKAIDGAVNEMAGEITDFLTELVRAESINPPGNTTAAARVVQAKLEEFDGTYEVHSFDEDKPNIILRAGASGGTRLCLNSHMDTVPGGETSRWKYPPFGGEIAEGNLYGRGSADAKGCAVAMLMAVRALERTGIGLAGGLDVSIVSDEETGGSIGTQYLLEKGVIEPDLAIIGEITSNRVAIAEKGMLVFTINTKGRTAHASTPWEGVSAISHMAKLIREIEATLDESFKTKRHPLTPPPSYNFGMIEGGVGINVVPDECRVTLDRRTLPGESLDEAETEIAEVIERLRKADSTFEAEYSLLYRANSFETPPDSDIVRSASTACELLGIDPQPIGYQQICDGRFFAEKDIPTIIIGPGTAELAHTPDEHVPVAAVIQAVKLYALAAVELLGIK